MSLKVLLADDSMTAQNMAKKILADSGYEVTTVSNGAAAVKKIAEVKPDLVILDIYMPGYTGLEVCERVRANLETTNIPVLLTVGKMEPYRPEDGARVRADGIIVKPFEATDLLAIVKKISEKFAPTRKAAPASYEAAAMSAAKEEVPETNFEEFQPVPRVEIPSDIAVAPAMAFDEVPSGSVTPIEMQWAPSPAKVAHELTAAAGFEMEPPPPPPPPPFSFSSVQAQAEVGTITDSMPAYAEPDRSAPSFEMEPLQSQDSGLTDSVVAPLPEIEFNAVPQSADVEVTASADLEPTIRPNEAALDLPAPDPALVTDTDELAKFTTSFGVENAEEVPVGTVTGDEAFLAETSGQDLPEPLAPEQVFTSSPAQEEFVPETPAYVDPEPVGGQIAAEPNGARRSESLDDFEARVAAAMSAFDQPLETASVEEPVVEQVDNFIGDPEVPNPVSVEPVSEPEPTPEPTVESRRTLDVNETMVLPAEALLSLEAEMRKAMELRKAVAEPEPVVAPEPAQESAFHAQPDTAEETGAAEAFQEITTEAEPAQAFNNADRDFAAAVNAALSEVQSEPTNFAHEQVEEAQVAPLAMAAAAAAVPSMEKWANFGEEKLASAVQTAVERLKPQIIAEIVKALKGE